MREIRTGGAVAVLSDSADAGVGLSAQGKVK